MTSKYGTNAEYLITVDWEASVPHIYIETFGNAPIVSKDDYLQATIKIEGLGGFEDYSGPTKIKGRGNSTWGFPKKPYRLKLDKKAALLGLAEEKDWVLLANYLDPTLMFNAVAMKTGQLLEMPYTNNIIPVELTINNTYMGSYAFTEQVAVGKNRVNIEDGGTLLELDTYYDEPWKFKSTNYNLPVMVKYPELSSESGVSVLKNEFQVMENAIASSTFPGNNYTDYLDINSLVNLFIVCNLTDNEELNHPKSLYIYKPKDGKYSFGPLWDFDWAFGFEGTGTHFEKYDNALLWNSSSVGTVFFKRLLSDPKVKILFKQKWIDFKSVKMPELMTYLNKYATTIEASKKRDFAKWGTGSGDFTTDYQKMRAWMIKRAGYIDSFVANF
ncbi:CotH kinase family protein [Pedobacter panaciterrae]